MYFDTVQSYYLKSCVCVFFVYEYFAIADIAIEQCRIAAGILVHQC